MTAVASDSGEQVSEQPEARSEDVSFEVARLQAELEEARRGPHRRRLSDTRQSITHKFSLSGHEGYISIGMYDDGTPGEMFLKMAKQGSTVSGLVDTIAVLTSLALQYGVSHETLARKFQHSRPQPSGHTINPDIRVASSISDYVFTWRGLTFSASFREEYGARRRGD